MSPQLSLANAAMSFSGHADYIAGTECFSRPFYQHVWAGFCWVSSMIYGVSNLLYIWVYTTTWKFHTCVGILILVTTLIYGWSMRRISNLLYIWVYTTTWKFHTCVGILILVTTVIYGWSMRRISNLLYMDIYRYIKSFMHV